MSREEYIKELSKNRREIFVEMYELKIEVEKLLHRDFFKNLLEFYSYMNSIDGLSHWMFLYSSYLEEIKSGKPIEECDKCLSGKMRLIESLVFQLKESDVMDKIAQLNLLASKLTELKEVGNEF
jgi:EAL domain-containing protein (putative c-di-GMP-specific phosphodiesterase class I)